MTEQEQEHLDHELSARYDDVRERFADEMNFGDEPEFMEDDDEFLDKDEEPGDEPQGMTDVEADADTLASAGYGTDEDYGGCDDHPF